MLLEASAAEPPPPPWSTWRRLDRQLLSALLLPTLLDLLASCLLNLGLLSVTASAAQMLRQSLLLFAALLGVAVFGKQLNGHHAAGLVGCTVRPGRTAARVAPRAVCAVQLYRACAVRMLVSGRSLCCR